MRNPIGAHVGGGKDLTKALTAAKRMGCEAIQVFLHSPTSFSFGAPDPALDETFREAASDRNLRVFIHGPYITNFGSQKDYVREKGVELWRLGLDRARAVGAEGVVLHSGSSGDDGLLAGLDRVKASLLPLLEALDDDHPPVLLEPMAGQGTTLASTVDSIAVYLNALDWHPKMGVCLDTAHLWGAGEDISREGGMADLLERFDRIVGFDRLKLIHSNDSQAELDSKRDRHANLDRGVIGLQPWRELFEEDGIADVPLILETAGSGVRRDMAILKKIRSEVQTAKD